MTDDPRAALDFPATRRNREPILDIVRTFLPATGRVLEIGAGSGQHAAFLAAAFPGLEWLASDPEAAHLASIRAWAAIEGADNVAALGIDATRPDDWPAGAFDAILAINVIHISPWPVAEAILDGAAQHLAGGGYLYLYGPFRVGGRHTAASNERFDAALRAQDPAWGVRDLDDVTAAAAERGLDLAATHEMPANNLSVVFRR